MGHRTLCTTLFLVFCGQGMFSEGQEPATVKTVPEVGEIRGSKADLIVPVWPAEPPAWDAPSEPERDTTKSDGRQVAGKRVIRLGFVSKPELHVYRAEKGAGDTAILICPGGGYTILAWDLEGTEIAQRLQKIGITAIVVKYRVPTRQAAQRWLAPVQDIQRSISLVRAGGIEGVSVKQVGVLGFSAGGNACARVVTASERHYQAIDAHDEASPSPDFGVLVYPAWLADKDDLTRMDDEIKVTQETSPMFFAHAADDKHSCMNSVTMFSRLQEHGPGSALHVFSSGGHGFGGRAAGTPTDAWLDLLGDWLRDRGWLKP